MAVHCCRTFPCRVCNPTSFMERESAIASVFLPDTKVEQRIMYIHNRPSLPACYMVQEYTGDDWFGEGPDAAASYPWLMNNCIVWVERRVVYVPEPWVPVGPDSEMDNA